MELHVRSRALPGSIPGALHMCKGTHLIQQEPVPCPRSCIAHYEAWGGKHLPNAILATVDLLPGTEPSHMWTGEDHACLAHAGERPWLAVHINSADFLDDASRVVPVWTVSRFEPHVGDFVVNLFADEESAMRFYDLFVDEYEDDYACDD
ncbi:hypothetical protein GCM10009798_33550 [Nocardioides panacihumi]|uniref:Uncharacterized protein n=1 Tax=Nocardioides panacihumi TaxID=400774 RepID=A0ABP5CZI2_9ACTN